MEGDYKNTLYSPTLYYLLIPILVKPALYAKISLSNRRNLRMSPIVLAYIIFLLVFAVYSGVGIYHLLRFGYVGDLTKPIALVYLLLSGLVIVATIVVLLMRNLSIN